MSLFGWAIASMLMVISFFVPHFMKQEAVSDAIETSVQQDAMSLYAYAGYVRYMFQKWQEFGHTNQMPGYRGGYEQIRDAIEGGRSVSMQVFGKNTLNAQINVAPPSPPPDMPTLDDPDYITPNFVDYSRVGNAMAKVPDTNVIWLYSWVKPKALGDDERDSRADPLIKKMLSRMKGNYYIKKGDILVAPDMPDKNHDLPVSVRRIIPDDALVIISHPFGQGPLSSPISSSP